MNFLTATFGVMMPRAPLSPAEETALSRLAPTLNEFGYSEAAICRLLNLADVPHRRWDQVRGYIWNCRQADGPVARLIRLWLLRDSLPAEQVYELLGRDLVAVLLRLEFLSLEGDSLTGQVDIYPCLGRQIITDQRFAHRAFTHQVYQLGTDSYVLARVTPRKPVKRALDLCTGSGVHPVMAAGHSQESWGVDINPRAIEFSGHNARANGVGARCHFPLSNLYEKITGEFGLITANPPFVPTPEIGMELFRTGGESGEEVTARIVAGVARHLEVGGTFSMFTNYPVMRGSHHLDRMAEWLGGAQGWGLAVTNFLVMSRELFISLHAPAHGGDVPFQAEFDRYLESYDRLGIEAVVAANFYVRRLPPGTPGWRAEHTLPFPCVAIDETVSDWLDALEQPLPDLGSWQPQRHSQFDRFLLDAAGGGGVVTYRQPEWAPSGQELTEPQRFLLERLGTGTAAELGRQAVDRFGSGLDVDALWLSLRHALLVR